MRPTFKFRLRERERRQMDGKPKAEAEAEEESETEAGAEIGLLSTGVGNTFASVGAGDALISVVVDRSLFGRLLGFGEC